MAKNAAKTPDGPRRATIDIGTSADEGADALPDETLDQTPATHEVDTPPEADADIEDSGLPTSGLIGKVVAGRYQILALLGEGGMGAVYRARQLQMNRMVALKLLHAHVAAHKHALARFQREMEVTARLEHAHTIRVYDVGQTEDGQLFLAMELLDGQTLARAIELQRGPLACDRVLHIALQIAKALGAAHGEGIVHRDLKPENVMLLDRYGERDVVKVLDFGIARFLEGEDAQKITADGAVIGTPAYMSPEQASGAPLDVRTDLYSFGVMLFEMVTGRVPFNAPTTVGMLVAHVRETPPRPSQITAERIPVTLETLIMELLAKDPAARPQTALDVADRLEAIAATISGEGVGNGGRAGKAGTKRGTSPWVWLVVALLVVGVAGLGVWLALGGLGGGRMAATATSTATGAAADADAGAATDGGASADSAGASEVAALATTTPAATAATPEADSATAGEDAEAYAAGEVAAENGDATGDAAPADPRAALALAFTSNDEPDAPAACQTKAPEALAVLTKAAALLAGGRPTAARPEDAEAFKLLKDNAAVLASSPEGQVLLARAALRTAPTADLAKTAAEAAITLCDTWGTAHNVLGNILQQGRDLIGAKQAYLRAKDRDPAYAAPLLNLALIELDAKHPKDALAALDELLRRRPDFPDARLLRGEALLRAGDATAAVVDLEAATRIDAQAPTGWMLLGQARQKSGDLAGAEVAYCRAKALGMAAAAPLCDR